MNQRSQVMGMAPKVGRSIFATAPLLPHMAMVATSAANAMRRVGEAVEMDIAINVTQPDMNIQYIKIG
jgi:hypothetical protein